MDFAPPGRVVRVGDPRRRRWAIRDNEGRWWAGEERRWSDKPDEAVLFRREIDATEARNRHGLLAGEADTFRVTTVLTVHAGRWSRVELSRFLRRHRKFAIGGPAGRGGLLLEILADTLRKVTKP
jgi:hypothetical protein